MGASPIHSPGEVSHFLTAPLDGVFLVPISQLAQSLMARGFTQAAQLSAHLTWTSKPRPQGLRPVPATPWATWLPLELSI